MVADNRTFIRLDRLAQDVIKSSGKDASAPQDSWMEGHISAVGSDRPNWLFLVGETVQLYFDALAALERDPVFKGHTREDLDEYLAVLGHDLFVNREQMSNSRVRHERIQRFFTELAQPLVPYEVVFDVEGIRFGSGSLTVGDVVFREFGPELAKGWDYTKAEGSLSFRDILRKTLAEFASKPVGIVTVQAGSARRAVGRAQGYFDHALNTLRLCIGAFPWAVVYDQELLQRRGRFFVVRQLEPEVRPVQIDGSDRFQRMDCDLAGPLEESTEEFIERLAPLYDGTIQGWLRDALLRSVEWVGTSITREHYDHKIVDIFTALETVLTTSDDSRKDEAIALRSMLLSMALGDGSPPPRDLLHLYRLRADVVHGISSGVCAKSDFRELFWRTKNVILNTIELNNTRGPLTRPSHLIELLESRERLEQAVGWLERWQDEDTRAVAEYAKSRLQEQEREPV